MFEQFSYQEAKDFYDAIEWLAKQPWCNGKVGIWGGGYFAMNAYNVAALQPPSLKAMIPIGGDSNSYRDYIFTSGGLYNTFNGVLKNSCGEWQGVEWVDIAMANPFDDPSIYGPKGKICISPEIEKITVPFWSGMGLSGTLHTRGTSEAFIRASSKHKKMTMISETNIHFWAYAPQFLEKHMAFFDYWLKGIDNGIMNEAPINMMVRTGWGGYYWQDEHEWPLARTKYTKLYLDASPSDWAGDGKRNDFFKLGPAIPRAEQSRTYNAGVEWNPETCWQHGISFVTEPMAEDTLLAGYMKLVIWVSSTTHDMELHASVRVMDENNREVHYPVGVFDAAGLLYFPIGFGGLKVSHRKLDPALSTVYRPYHTHRKKDYQPLTPGEAVEAEVEIWPSTALIRKGWRLRLDVGPVSGSGIGLRIHDAADQSYQKGSANTVYTGPKHPSYLQLPVIPPRE
jgi:putative CocE/NonD family hydrolase